MHMLLLKALPKFANVHLLIRKCVSSPNVGFSNWTCDLIQ